MFDLLKMYQFAASLDKLSDAPDKSTRQAASLGNDILTGKPQFANHLKKILKLNNNFTLSCPLTEQGITLLHLAAITGNISAAKALLAAGSPIDFKDNRLWTPLHHAALIGNLEMIDFLLSNGADPQAKTNKEGTYQDILHLVHRKPLPANKILSLTYLTVDEKEFPLSVGDYLKLTGFHYIDDLFIDPECYLYEWLKPQAELSFFDFSQYYKTHRHGLLQHLPHCILSPLTDDNLEGQPIGQGYVGLYAGEAISIGQAIVEYCCHLSLRTDAKMICFHNESAFIPEGFPNCSLISYANASGASLRGIIIAVDPIEKGELLCRHYPEKQSKLGPYSLLRCEEMADFVKANDIQHLMDEMMLQMGSPQISIGDYVRLNKISHIVGTPAALWWLILHEVISIDTACYIVAAGSLAHLISADEFPHYEALLKTAKACLIIKALILNTENEAADQFLEILTDFVKKYPLSDALFRAADLCTMWRNILKAYEKQS